ncbi:uncharacterized protein LOC106865880 isoform X2 [Brachypodium distachyon]|uniref:uncharacterized protein LOC106865880 isoform X2 n=2 Tax=Brachypodium distachyon TaxID=15368 RepID=UPI000D0CDBA3|nr:uncharacterized protein LOC106865880 isoform X2 [Brachypodium distachyon]XP_024312827.1 uncharacterized protein LOC106865880 isoform X2 [Brachypodium distachyon]XP_024312828.1 uncharacterized protein LOC106865880 isoform X2 [Brachypodium distachyon]|eukprot:XP_024312826.1 uncharacterized protein LOC106865880 isoform X2 [Brachypodium distachyon]
MPYQLRQLFVTILLLCEVTNHRKLLDEYASKMSEDAAHCLNRNPGQMSNLLADVYISSFLLNELDKLLKDARYCLSHFNLPLPDDIGSISAENRLMLDELSYDISDMTESLDENITRLNSNKKNVFDAIYNSAMNDDGRTFFVYGYGGTGKTFLWTTLLNSVRRQGKIALAVASSGIASLLLPGGRTSHSRFKIPLDISQNSMCSIKKNTNLAEFIQKTSLIIWNEAPVNHRYCFEALDRTLRDILSKRRQNADSKQFGGMDSTTTLKSITLGQQSCKVFGRLLRIWDAVNMKSKFPDPLISIDGVILDEDGTMAQINVSKKFQTKCRLFLAEGYMSTSLLMLQLLIGKTKAIYITIRIICYNSSTAPRFTDLNLGEQIYQNFHSNFVHSISCQK